MTINIDDWFVSCVLPLEGDLNDYLRRSWNDRSEIADLRQEVYVRIYAKAKSQLPDNVRKFLFTVARNLMIDKLRRNRIVPIDLMFDMSLLHLVSDEVGAHRTLSSRQELARLRAAVEKLPPRCREVFILRKIEEFSQKEAAEKMGISEATVEKQIGKAMRFLAQYFWNYSEAPDYDDVIVSAGGANEARR